MHLGALARLADEPQPATVHPDDLPSYRQPETGVARPVGPARRAWHIVRGHARSLVAHGHLDLAATPGHADSHLAARGRELHRVVDDDHQQLLDARAVAHHDRGFAV